MRYGTFHAPLLVLTVCTLSSIPFAAESCKAHSGRYAHATTEHPIEAEGCTTDRITNLIKQYASSKDSDELEAHRILFSSTFDACPAEVLKLALNANLDGEMIGRMISALPISFVDRPCAVERKVDEKLGKLASVKRDIKNPKLEDTEQFMRHLSLVNSKACQPKYEKTQPKTENSRKKLDRGS